MPENKSGNGYESPFGNGKGATSDGPYSGAHDFLTDPESNAPKTGGRDFTQENREQPAEGMALEINKDSIPDGGTLPFPDADPEDDQGGGAIGMVVDEPKHKPFKLGGGENPY